MTHLFYEAYESMALKQIRLICEDQIKQKGLAGMAIVHRTGEVPISEGSVIVMAVSGHRRAAIDAMSEAIDKLKERVPIWKKEFYGDGSDA